MDEQSRAARGAQIETVVEIRPQLVWLQVENFSVLERYGRVLILNQA